MSDYLGNLIARTVAPAICVRPQVPSIFESPALNAGNSELYFEQERCAEEKSLPRTEPEARSVSDPSNIRRTVTRETERERCAEEKSLPRIEPDARSVSDQSNIHRTVTHETEIIRHEIIQPKIVDGQSEGKRVDDTTLPVRAVRRRDESDRARDHLPGERRVRSSQTIPDSPEPSPAGTVAQPSSTLRDHPVVISRRPESNAVEVHVPRIRPKARPLSDRVIAESPTPPPPVVSARSIAPKLQQLKPQRLPVVRAVVPLAQSLPQKPASTQPEPTISVTIGRVEIRAVPQPAERRAKPKPATILSLQEYLRQRAAGGAR
jgi:hypothetical protein